MRVTNNKKHILELISKIGEEVGLNSLFDSMDQIMTMTRRDGQELFAVAMSPTTGVLDLPTQRENAQIIDSMMVPYEAGAVDHSQYQEICTTMVKTQAFSVEMEYAGADRSCQGATRKLTVVTARPLINGGDAFIEVRPDVYKSLAAENAGSLFFANTANKFKASYQSQGKQILYIPRLIQTWEEVKIRFHQGKNILVDYFSFILPKETGISLSTKCGDKWESHWVPNDTLIEIPYFCSGYTEGRVFFRSIGMQRREGNDSVDSMLHRQSRKPLIVKIAANKLKKEINATNIKFQQIEDGPRSQA